MATIIDEHIPSKSTPWEGYAGQRVEEYIKEQLEMKAGVFQYVPERNKYYVFADAINQALYWSDPQAYSSKLIVAFDAPAEYSMSIDISTPVSNAVLIGSTGNYITFTPRVENRSGDGVSENVSITYTFKRGSNTTVVYGTTTSGTRVSLNIDQYLLSGTNTITIQCMGQTTLAGSMASVQYEVVDLTLTDTFDISKPITYGTGVLSVPFTISGSGIKNMEWYIDGVQLAVDNTTDSISYTTVTMTKNIALNSITKKSGGTMSLAEGRHHLQFRAYVTIGGQNFYSKTLYREFVVRKTSSSSLSNPIVLSKGELPSGASNIVASNSRITYNLVQYVPYTFTFAAYNPSSNTTSVQLKVGESSSSSGVASLPTIASLTMANEIEYTYTYTPTTNGTRYLWAYVSASVMYYFTMSIEETDMDLAEITGNLDFAFDARGRTNEETSHTFSYNNGTTTHNGTFHGFDWNDTSGWNDDSLLIDAGSYFKVETFKPFSAGMVTNGYTFEIEFATENVSNDDAVVCNMAGVSDGYMNKNGLYISASSAGISCDTWRTNEDKEKHALKVRFKSGEYIRISFVINRMSGGNDDKTAFVYINGRLSGVMAYAASSSFANQTGDTCYLKVQGTSGASVRLRQIRCYSTALNADQILNNYILYRPTLNEMKSVYDRNDIYSNGDTLDFDVLANAMPIMKVTGDLSILEDTTDKNTQIQVAEIEYTNLQDPTRSFRMTNAAMRPQGTSSMQYPKKNFRIYTSRYNETKLYDYLGNEVEKVGGKLLYSFKQGSIPVPTWCLKADFAESSSSHNTGVARLWNKLLYDATISFSSSNASGKSVSNAHAFRTHAQEAALANGYQYDVRTCIDGFPIMLFYRATVDQPYIFMGKYNFNNDKSTENVFGFKGIPGFDDEYINGNSGPKYEDCMQCWEVKDSANPIALFNTVANFDSKWDEAFEPRYPDVGDAIANDTTRFTQMKNFCTWVSDVTQQEFADQKWLKLDVYKVAAYYVYLMVFGAVDQTTKNAMITSEDGTHYYYINYDNDTILGVRNDGVLAFPPTIDRQSSDTTVTGTEAYAYAGHNNRLWNLCEADTEFMAIVKVVYSSLVSAGLTYANLIDMFDTKQSLAWCERIFNLDADYKYLTPYRSTPPKDNLSMVQGARSSHRRWWLSKRLAIYDAKFVAGEYRGKQFWFRVFDSPSGLPFTITAGVDFVYCYGINGTPLVDGVNKNAGETLTFTTDRPLNVGSPINIFGGYYLKGVDLSGLSQYLDDVHVENINSDSLGNMLETLVIGSSSVNSGATISGLATATKLKTLNVRRCTALTSLDISANKEITSLEARGSSISSITFANGSKITTLGVPTTLTQIELNGCANAVFGNFNYESGNSYGKAINKVKFTNCLNSSMKNNWSSVWNWYSQKSSDQKSAIIEYYQDNINWTSFDSTAISNLISMKQALGSKLKIYGKITLSSDIDSTTAATLQTLFGQNCFKSSNDLYIQINSDIVFWSGADEVVEGGANLVLTFNVISSGTGTISNVSFTRQSGGTHSVTTSWSSQDNTLTVTVAETGAADAVYRVMGYFTRGGNVVSATMDVNVKKATYPPSDGVSITGPTQITTSSAVYQRDPSSFSGYTGSTTGGWTLTGDITNYASIVDGSATDTSVSVSVFDSNYYYASGTLTYTLYQHASGSGGTGTALWSVTKTIYLLSNNIAVSTATNSVLMSFLWSKFGNGVSGSRPYNSNGDKLQNQDYITKTEAAAFEVDSSHTTSNWSSAGYGFVSGTSTTNGFFYSIRNTLTGFAEFKWFTRVTVIPDYFLCMCASMESFEFHSNVTEIKQYGLSATNGSASSSKGLQGEITFPLSLTTLGVRALCGHSRITKLIGNAVTSIANLAFQLCTGLTEVRFPVVTSIGERFISYASNLSLIYVPNVSSWSSYGIESCSANVVRPEIVIGPLAATNNYWNEGFAAKWKLTLSVYCTSFSNIIGRQTGSFPFVELGVESGNSIYFLSNGCVVDYATNTVRLIPNAENVTLPSGPTTIANETLRGHHLIKNLSIPASYTTINNADGIVGLQSCESIVVDSGNTTFDSRDNCNALVLSSSNKIVIGCKNTTFPSSITSIGAYAFQRCTGLTSITLPSTITSVGDGAFHSATGLLSATANAASYGTSVFQSCTGLTKLDIGAACTSLGSRFTYAATNLSTILMRSASVPSLGTTWSETPFGIGSNTAGYNTRNDGINKLYVPSALISSYQSNTTMTKALLNASYGNFSVVDISIYVE